MIQSKKDLKFYLLCDSIACDHEKKWFKKYFLGHEWRFHKALRKTEYYRNCRKDPLGKLMHAFYFYLLRLRGLKTGWTIPPNTFGPGLCVVHIGTVVVNGRVRAGKNCRIQSCVNIGSSGGEKEAPHLGDNVYIAPGAKIYGDIRIGSGVAIGANAVVNKSFEEDNITIAGIPARIISDKGSHAMIKDAYAEAVKRMGYDPEKDN